MFSLICASINDGVNNREAGDLRRYRDNYDAIVMITALLLKGKSGEQSDDDLSYKQMSTASNNDNAANLWHWYDWL